MAVRDELRQNEVLARLTLKRIRGLGPGLTQRLIEVFGGVCGVFSQDRAALLQVPGLTREQAASFGNPSVVDEALREIDRAQKQGIRILVPESGDYPSSLSVLTNPPSVLYVKGEWVEDEPRLAIVGTRLPTVTGVKTARSFAGELASCRIAVVSGLARGIDTMAHEGTLDVGGRTIAVLGSGLFSVYPKENRRLAERITESGAVVSEFFLDEAPQDYHFPLRNRLISGLAHGVIIVEAPRKSGALITVGHALDQGKEVFALPGSVSSVQSAGSNQLIKEGAHCVTEPDDILFHMGWPRDRCRQGLGFSDSQEGVNATHRRILDEMSRNEPLSVDDLQQSSELSLAELLRVLSEMEMTGMVSQLPGHRYVRGAPENIRAH